MSPATPKKQNTMSSLEFLAVINECIVYSAKRFGDPDLKLAAIPEAV